MKRFLPAALLALPLLALAAPRASAGGCGDCCCSSCCFSPTITANFGFKFKCWGGLSCCCDHDCCSPCCGSSCGGGCGGCCPTSPWYSFWPYDAHFMTPAPTGYPYWPAGMGAMMYGGQHASAYGPPPPPMALPMPAPMPYTPAPAVQPCGYFPNQVPSYWYGR